MNKNIYFFLALITLLAACKSSDLSNATFNEVILDEIEVKANKDPYRGAETRVQDLLHTKLDVSFDWEKQHLFGKAWVTSTPYFYATDKFNLDAKGMDINKVALVASGSTKDLKYNYDGLVLEITLDKKYRKSEQFTVYIEYVSKPNELEKTEGLSAISDDKGLYFINPTGEDGDKPRQIWTQGEPESNSVWFPTIDSPNERCTQEISITVEKKFIAMSNGSMISDTDNGDGTHTTYWKQDKPHAPYLFMMAIGEFHETKDDLDGLSINYYVEEEYAAVAQRIFGKTPRMITFFADQLGVDYAWDKYWQVIVRDYVSGAMENTSAVIFGEFVQRDARELLDEDHEDIVSHELYHHWFGDLVTCENWANLPLNESFATYGEVLWREHEFGADAKGRKVYDDMQAYFNEARQGKQVDMIRYYHDTAEDMFDSHSYAKGGTILNMLRTYVGDDAFFESLRVYLEDNKFQSVEIHNLRLAFEKVTGEDLNWFFNQWFLSSGHPEITIDYKNTENSTIVTLTQNASAEKGMLYRLPMSVDIYDGNNFRREEIVFDEQKETFEFLTSGNPFLVNVDAEKATLAIIEDNKSKEAWIFQFMNARNFMDRLTALEALAEINDDSKEIKDVFTFAINDPYWYIQSMAIDEFPLEATDTDVITKLKALALKADKTDVQAAALFKLSELEDEALEPIFEAAMGDDMSYAVNGAGLETMMYTNPERALEKAAEWENSKNFDVKDAVSYVYTQEGDASKAKYFENQIETSDNWEKYYGVYYYSLFLKRMDKDVVLDGMNYIENFGLTDKGSYSKSTANSALARIQKAFNEEAEMVREEMNASGISKSQKMALESELIDYQFIIDRATTGMKNLAGM